MSKFQPSRSQVPVDERSVLATVPGLPWWGAVLTLLSFTAAGALAAGEFAGANAGMLAMSVGAILAVLAVRNRALFTTMVQPPLVIATAIPLYRWYALPSPRKTSEILTDVLFPMISLFPWMFWITVIVIVIGGARLVLYRQLTATARSAQRSAPARAKSAKPTGKPAVKKPAVKKPAESDGLPIAERIRAVLKRLRPSPAAAMTTSTGGAAALVGAGAGRSERHQSGSSRSQRARGDRPERSETTRAGRAEARMQGRSSAARRTDSVRDEAPRLEPSRRELTRREEIARRDEGAPATQINRVVRPDSAPIRRPQPLRRPVEDERRADVPRGARPRPAVGQGDRPRPFQHDSHESRRDPAARLPEPPRYRALRDPELRGETPSGPRRALQRPDARDYRREAGDLDRARGVDPRPQRPERERPRLPRDDYASLPRISGGRAAQPDLPSLSSDGDRPSRRSEPTSNPGRYEHYRPPRYRPQGDEAPADSNYRDDFADPTAEPRQIRRHRYKD